MNSLIDNTTLILSSREGARELVSSAPVMVLVKRVAEHGDREALDELVCRRRLFRWGANEHLRLAEFLFAYMRRGLPKRPRQEAVAAAERAYDLTLDKFGNLDGVFLGGDVPEDKERSGTDCRHYYKAFLRMMNETPCSGTALERDADAAARLQRFVIRHFHLSLLEAKRTLNVFMQRYNWRVNGRHMTLYMPRHMKGREKGLWLDANIPPEWLDRADARQRVQAYIDDQFKARRVLSQFSAGEEVPTGITDAPLGLDLGAALADEKVGHIQNLRPAIRDLGTGQLRCLIIDIFQNLNAGEYNQSAMAHQYELSLAALSRFAGSRWLENGKQKNGNGVPCLWRNLAGVVARDERLVQVARRSGVWPCIQAMANVAEERTTHGPE